MDLDMTRFFEEKENFVFLRHFSNKNLSPIFSQNQESFCLIIKLQLQILLTFTWLWTPYKEDKHPSSWPTPWGSPHGTRAYCCNPTPLLASPVSLRSHTGKWSTARKWPRRTWGRRSVNFGWWIRGPRATSDWGPSATSPFGQPWTPRGSTIG